MIARAARTRWRSLADRLSRGAASNRADWEGVFASVDEVGETGPGFAGDWWIELATSVTQRELDLPPMQSPNPTHHASVTQLLATLVAARTDERPVRILDFGGGMGAGFVQLRKTVSPARQLDYVIVDGKRTCEAGARLLHAHTDVRFGEELPAPGTEFDIVFACSSLQYIDGLPTLFERFASYSPAHVLLVDVPAGDVPSFWTAQLSVIGSRIAYHFMNLSELVDALRAHNYRLVMSGPFRTLPVANLPIERRIARTCNLLFGR